MTADERMRETMAASQALARCFLSQDKVIYSSSFFMYNPSLIIFSISNLFNNWYSFLDALASLESMMSVIVSLTEINWVTDRKFSLLQDVM